MAKKITICTQIYLLKNGRVCLPLKKRGFGLGWHNGYGGKVQAGETLAESAKRELQEESQVEARLLKKQAVLTFNFLQTGEKIISHVYRCEQYIGRPKETEEMKPFWFSFKRVPYSKMWPDDTFWFESFLKGKCFQASFDFLDNKPTIGAVRLKFLNTIK